MVVVSLREQKLYPCKSRVESLKRLNCLTNQGLLRIENRPCHKVAVPQGEVEEGNAFAACLSVNIQFESRKGFVVLKPQRTKVGSPVRSCSFFVHSSDSSVAVKKKRSVHAPQSFKQMSLSALAFFIYTPIPYAVILCIILYRHDLSQLVHPLKDRCSVRDWKSLFDDLEIARKTSSSSSKKEGNGIRLDFLERHPNIGFYLSVLAIVTSVSLLSSLVVVPVLLEGDSLPYSRFILIISAGLQFVSATPSTLAMLQYFGPFPSPPGKFHLKKRRPGSLLRYEETLNQQQVKCYPGTVLRSERLWGR